MRPFLLIPLYVLVCVATSHAALLRAAGEESSSHQEPHGELHGGEFPATLRSLSFDSSVESAAVKPSGESGPANFIQTLTSSTVSSGPSELATPETTDLEEENTSSSRAIQDPPSSGVPLQDDDSSNPNPASHEVPSSGGILAVAHSSSQGSSLSSVASSQSDHATGDGMNPGQVSTAADSVLSTFTDFSAASGDQNLQALGNTEGQSSAESREGVPDTVLGIGDPSYYPINSGPRNITRDLEETSRLLEQYIQSVDNTKPEAQNRRAKRIRKGSGVPEPPSFQVSNFPANSTLSRLLEKLRTGYRASLRKVSDTMVRMTVPKMPWSEAVALCSHLRLVMCSYEDVCPRGRFSEPASGLAPLTMESWTPVLDQEQNSYTPSFAHVGFRDAVEKSCQLSEHRDRESRGDNMDTAFSNAKEKLTQEWRAGAKVKAARKKMKRALESETGSTPGGKFAKLMELLSVEEVLNRRDPVGMYVFCCYPEKIRAEEGDVDAEDAEADNHSFLSDFNFAQGRFHDLFTKASRNWEKQVISELRDHANGNK